MVNMAIKLSGIELKNPLIPASGTYGYGMDFLDFYDVNLCGSMAVKGTTVQAREGNSLPRIAECYGGMINSVGLQNPGAQAVAEQYLPKLAKIYHAPVFANVSGFSVEEYVEATKILTAVNNVGWIELNISCPNVHGGGMSFGLNPSDACTVLAAVKKVTAKPVYVKCTPQCQNLVEMCKALEQAGADGLVLLNTWVGMALDAKTGKPILKNITGGVSGKCIFHQSLQKVYQVYGHVNIPIIGCGGIHCGQDVIDMMSAGASAVEIGTSNLIDPMSVPRILNELEILSKKYEITDIHHIIGRSFR